MYRILAANRANRRKTFTGPLAETMAVLKAAGWIILSYTRN